MLVHDYMYLKAEILTTKREINSKNSTEALIFTSKTRKMTHEDSIYLTALCQNDQLKVLELYKKCFPAVDRWIGQNNGSTQDAKDIFQEVLIDLYTRFCIKDNFTLTTNICSFLGYVSKMKWLRALAKSRNSRVNVLREELNLEYKDVTNSIETHIIATEERQQQQEKMKRSFGQLSKSCQKLLTLDTEGYTTEEIVELMEFSNRNVLDASKSRCYRKWRSLYQAL